ncbi:MAG TPA: hypothetical protein VKH37_10845 [Ferruginibacter sp.]|nr:hypothetical protein [Ferruginibacter sp.]
MSSNRNIFLALMYFLFSTAITWWFIQASPLYTSTQQKMLSCGIAGAKWSIQILAALIFLKEKRWMFIKDIGLTCFIGSMILLPFCILSAAFGINGSSFFVMSLLVAVAVMILMYAISVRHARLHIRWWLGWMLCLAIAISLQLTIVFHVF